MKIAICFFSYEKDAALLNAALRGVKRLQEMNPADVLDVYVYDDAAAPMGREAVPGWVEYAVTEFDRKGNLNGLECILGQLGIYAGLVEGAAGYDWVIKVDSDTYINTLEWLRGVDARKVGYVGTNHVEDYGSGSCYALSRVGAAGVKSLLEREVIRKRCAVASCEDRVFCRLCRMTGLGMELRRNAENEIKPLMLYHDWWHGGARVELVQLVEAAAVDFKRCRWHTPAETWEDDRALALERMEAYADMMDARAAAAAGEAAVEDEEVAEALGWCGETEAEWCEADAE